MSLLAELKRRNVIRAAGLYLVTAWLVVQVVGTVLPIFHVPNWILRAIVIVLAIGFVPALLSAWVFEWTPGGFRRDGGTSLADAPAPQLRKRMNRSIIVLLALALGYFAIDRLVSGSMATDAPAASDAAAESLPEVKTATTTEPETVAPPPAASIAVLPFVNMSNDAENGYFADGISEELLNVLAGIQGLAVASRTSSFTFKDKDTSIPEIARQLGVRHVLEGSVRKQGQRVRITAQLIEAGSDAHLWSETYDRDLTDIFKVQEEIAQAIGDSLVGLLPVAPKVSVTRSTRDLEAYERFLRGRARFQQRKEFAEAVSDLESAVARDPDFADAWVYLAATLYTWPGYDGAVSTTSLRTRLLAALARARDVAPDHALPVAIQGMMLTEGGDFLGGVAILQRAAAMPADDVTPTFWYGITLLFAGYSEEAGELLLKAQRRDPLSGVVSGYLSIAALHAGDDARATTLARRALDQGWEVSQFELALEYALRGDQAKAFATLEPLANAAPAAASAQRNALFNALADPSKANDYVAMLPPDAIDPFLLAIGQQDLYLERWLGDVRASRPLVGSSFWMMRTAWLPSAGLVREHPRFHEIARISGLLALWEARGYPHGCRTAGDGDAARLRCDARSP